MHQHDTAIKNIKPNMPTSQTHSCITSKRKALYYGFSIIELMVVLAIMAVIFTIGTANYRAYANRKAVENAAYLIKGDLRLAQEYALSGRKPCTDPNALLEYIIFRKFGASAYRIEAKCTGSSLGVLIKQSSISDSEILLSNFPNTITNRIHFLPRGSGVSNFHPGFNSTTFTVSRGPYSTAITVTSGGEIK